MSVGRHVVLVYGTLKRGEPNHKWLDNVEERYSKFLNLGRTVEKYPLIIGTKYNIPFLLDKPGVGHNVIGEIYEVNESMLSHLDELEDHPNFYVRRFEKVKLIDQPEKVINNCWIYFLTKFKPELLIGSTYYENYSSSGSHNLIYCERDNEAIAEDL